METPERFCLACNIRNSIGLHDDYSNDLNGLRSSGHVDNLVQGSRNKADVELKDLPHSNSWSATLTTTVEWDLALL